MNDIVQLLQHINEMNSAWLQVAVSAQSAFDTMDAAAFKTQKVLKDTIADVDGLGKRLVGINGGIQISVNSEQISAAQKQIKQLQSQSETIKGNNTIASEGKIEESKTFADKAITTATKSIVKGGITSVIEDKALGTAVKEELATGFRGLVADEAGEFIASSAGGILGDVLGGGIAGGLEVALGAVAPEIVIPVVAVGALIKGIVDRNIQKENATKQNNERLELEKNSILRSAGLGEEISLDGTKEGDEKFYTAYSNDSDFALPQIGNDRSTSKLAMYLKSSAPYNKHNYDLYKTTYDPFNLDFLEYSPGKYWENQKEKNFEEKWGEKVKNPVPIDATLALLKQAHVMRGKSYVDKATGMLKGGAEIYDKILFPIGNYQIPFRKPKLQSTLADQLGITLKNYKASVAEENKADNKQPTGRVLWRTASRNTEAQGKVINININRAFIENFSIHAQNIQQGYDNLKQKVEEIFLEILNSANATHD